MAETNEILRVEHLKKYFDTPAGTLHAVDDITFSLDRGRTLGVVGESGCGKSTMGRAILRLHEPTSGKVWFEGQDILSYDKKRLKALRKDMQIIFQDPFASLNPRMTVAEAIAAPLVVQNVYSRRDKKGLRKKVAEFMDLVGLAPRLVNTYPHELDGGRRQRIGIARALALSPKFIVCDEPVSALDVSIQAQILNLMQDLQDRLGLTYLFITHDLSVVKFFSDDIIVMYLGQMVEKAPSDLLFKNPLHPYTKALLSAIPVADPNLPMQRIALSGEISSPVNPPKGCRFAKRCPYAEAACTSGDLTLAEVEANHFVSCVKVE
ncbi:ABC transporter ATP-binding protein [Pyramidobacter piscolens]|uniref:ABC transporter, ATP-binding protein n=1 Tax=Pyramidobacter piscolens W5455 TaxID=352165 RepID=A0ABP2HV09_9BACT|nr:oligopeptide/dipeptide ABC transporter ATP-binding protein [Pyramidobacter piscolens]EFB91122.1 ABC transporter, ATP-binding protein [Pyramidobacter piscolens W5455]BDF77505.1 ABC transporter ATP-binding protein [Pyramidobacter piscolens]